MRAKQIMFAAVLVCVFGARIGYVFLHIPKSAAENHASTFEATVISQPQIHDFDQIMQVETVSGSSLLAAPLVLTTNKYINISYGDMLSLTGTATAPRNFSSGNGDTFDYAGFLLKDGITSVIKTNNVQVVAPAGFSFTGFLYQFKRRFMENVRQVMGEPEASFAGGLVLGEKQSMSKDLLNDFSKVGLIHIVVLSGYNIAVIATTIKWFVSFLPDVAANIAGGIGIIIFGMLVGGKTTAVRACIMAVIAVIASVTGRRYDPGRALIVAAGAMIFWNPLIILYDPSFQLTFPAVAGLVWLSPFVKKFLQWVPEKFGLRELAIATVAIQLAVTPIMVRMVGQVSILGIFANLIVLPLVPITMMFVALTGVAGFISTWLSWPFAAIAHVLLSYILFVVAEFAKIPWVSISFK